MVDPAIAPSMATWAGDMRTVVTKLGHDHVAVVGHDIGTMVAYAYAALSTPSAASRSAIR